MSVAVLFPASVTRAPAVALADLDEPTLIERAKSGDNDAFGELIRRNQDVVLRVVSRRLRAYPSDVDDVASEVFLRAFNLIATYEDRGRPFAAWLKEIARWRTTAHRSWREHRREEQLAPTEGSDIARVLAERALNPENQVILRLELRRLLRSLPGRRRLALILRDWAGWSYEEIARALNLSERAADALVTNARKAVREAALGQVAARELYPSRPTRPAAQGSAQDRVLAAIEAAGSPGITRNVLRKRTDLPAAQLAGIVDQLAQQRLISVAQEPTLRTPITRYRAMASAAAGRAA